jgi:hypothetical protein
MLAVRFGLAEMPGGVTWPQFIGASFLAGIGFTMSLFITSSAFSDPALQSMAKLSILIASVVAAIIGTIVLLMTSPKHEGATELSPVVISTDIQVSERPAISAESPWLPAGGPFTSVRLPSFESSATNQNMPLSVSAVPTVTIFGTPSLLKKRWT